MSKDQLNLKGFSFQALLSVEGLSALDQCFLDFLHGQDAALCLQLLEYRQSQTGLTPLEVSQLLLKCAPFLEEFVAELFRIEASVARLQAATRLDDPIFAFKKYFVLREARRRLQQEATADFATMDHWLEQQLAEYSQKQPAAELSAWLHADREWQVARYSQALLQDVNEQQDSIDRLVQWCVLAMVSSEGQQAVAGWVSFRLPKKLNFANLVTVVGMKDDAWGRLQGDEATFRQRDGFNLTDPRMNTRQVQNEIHYCVYCHEKEGDFCSKGFLVKKGQPDLGFKLNPAGDTLIGCPLEEKISEMHWLKRQGYAIAALAMVMVDNPMCPATGHRICNDCMKACIYQKQEPVNIPQTETRILFDVLQLPWGVEIYDLLTRWNPLRKTQYLPKPYCGLKVLVMGMGPAGFALAHHLLMEGFAVVGVDGLKLEPLDSSVFLRPIRDFEQLEESLAHRVMAGFGGVAEYGITVRWDKNFLKLIYLSLLRRPYFQIFGSIRFGGTLTVEEVWALGFDHLALAVGAGLPRELRIPNSLAPGMRQANDFLMALQLTGASKRSSLANLQVRLPAVVIGGGLTGVDTATEVQAYYIAQVEKTLWRYETLAAVFGVETVRSRFDEDSLQVFDEFLQHGRQVRAERARADQEARAPDLLGLLRQWGGVTIAYRRMMQESPAYRRNYEELAQALEEGIYYAEGLEPLSVQVDQRGAVMAIVCRALVMDEEGNWIYSDEKPVLPARSIFVATGAQPNVAYEYEHKGTFARSGMSYECYRFEQDHLVAAGPLASIKSGEVGVFTSYERDHHRVSFLGDTHPTFHGSVVKAIASAQQAYPKIVESTMAIKSSSGCLGAEEYRSFRNDLEYRFRSKVIAVVRRADHLVELTVQSPMAARNFQPGQFYRIQNYEMDSMTVHHTRLQTEALALLGFKRRGTPEDQLCFMVFERGSSSRLVATFRPGMLLAVMGPTGARGHLSYSSSAVQQSTLVIGSEFSMPYLLSMGPALQKAGHHVLFLATFAYDRYPAYHQEIAEACDVVLWSEDEDFVDVLKNYKGFPLTRITTVVVIGEGLLIKRVRNCKRLKSLLAPGVNFLASVYGPMQCMLKGVCAQCLQWQIDPQTGQRKKAVYACSWQHQPIEKIDIENIEERLCQNRCQEILSGLWLDYLFAEHSVERV